MKKVRNKKIDGRFYTDEYIDKLVKKIYELENKIDKAIEYIEENEKEYGSLEENEKIILDILRGEDNGNLN